MSKRTRLALKWQRKTGTMWYPKYMACAWQQSHLVYDGSISFHTIFRNKRNPNDIFLQQMAATAAARRIEFAPNEWGTRVDEQGLSYGSVKCSPLWDIAKNHSSSQKLKAALNICPERASLSSPRTVETLRYFTKDFAGTSKKYRNRAVPRKLPFSNANPVLIPPRPILPGQRDITLATTSASPLDRSKDRKTNLNVWLYPFLQNATPKKGASHQFPDFYLIHKRLLELRHMCQGLKRGLNLHPQRVLTLGQQRHQIKVIEHGIKVNIQAILFNQLKKSSVKKQLCSGNIGITPLREVHIHHNETFVSYFITRLQALRLRRLVC